MNNEGYNRNYELNGCVFLPIPKKGDPSLLMLFSDRVLGKASDVVENEELAKQVCIGRCRENGLIVEGEPNEWTSYDPESLLSSNPYIAFKFSAADSLRSFIKNKLPEKEEWLIIRKI